eukprot:525631_1
MASIMVGDRVTVKRNKNKFDGVVRFIGEIQAKKGIFYGIELDHFKGQNDGSLHKVSYFKCEPKKGTFVSKQSIVKIVTKNKLFKYTKTINDEITVPSAGHGIIRFIGIPYSFNKEDVFYGIQLKKSKGKNNGSINGRWYFSCPRNCGIFIKCEKIPKPKEPTPPPPPIEPPNLPKGDLCFGQDNKVVINECYALLRLCSALKYYQQLNKKKDTIPKNKPRKKKKKIDPFTTATAQYQSA